jgi:hypothetical protein
VEVTQPKRGNAKEWYKFRWKDAATQVRTSK